jgi:hypothetical protein
MLVNFSHKYIFHATSRYNPIFSHHSDTNIHICKHCCLDVLLPLQIYAWLDSLAETYPGVVTPIVGGRSYEGRQIKGVKVSYKPGNPGVILEGGLLPQYYLVNWQTFQKVNLYFRTCSVHKICCLVTERLRNNKCCRQNLKCPNVEEACVKRKFSFAVVGNVITCFTLYRNSRSRVDLSRHSDVHPEQVVDQSGPGDTGPSGLFRLLRLPRRQPRWLRVHSHNSKWQIFYFQTETNYDINSRYFCQKAIFVNKIVNKTYEFVQRFWILKLQWDIEKYFQLSMLRTIQVA